VNPPPWDVAFDRVRINEGESHNITLYRRANYNTGRHRNGNGSLFPASECRRLVT